MNHNRVDGTCNSFSLAPRACTGWMFMHWIIAFPDKCTSEEMLPPESHAGLASLHQTCIVSDSNCLKWATVFHLGSRVICRILTPCMDTISSLSTRPIYVGSVQKDKQSFPASASSICTTLLLWLHQRVPIKKSFTKAGQSQGIIRSKQTSPPVSPPVPRQC